MTKIANEDFTATIDIMIESALLGTHCGISSLSALQYSLVTSTSTPMKRFDPHLGETEVLHRKRQNQAYIISH